MKDWRSDLIALLALVVAGYSVWAAAKSADRAEGIATAANGIAAEAKQISASANTIAQQAIASAEASANQDRQLASQLSIVALKGEMILNFSNLPLQEQTDFVAVMSEFSEMPKDVLDKMAASIAQREMVANALGEETGDTSAVPSS